ncbi:MAG: hypothetical protein JSW26_28350 [Desulfobacterales bacterium]|nr:MAG: hypothetical protein JSW26_28350 [Desulfobacterales bacterium]
MTLGIEERRFILRFEDVTLLVDPAGGERLNVRLDVYGGNLVLMRLERGRQGEVFADTCAGLISPQAGTVSFLGRSWARLHADLGNALRGRIGRVFRSGNWVDYLSLQENILLPQLYHTRRKAKELRDEAALLAMRLGLPGLPVGSHREQNRSDLQIAACVRAFLGHPVLVILQEPTAGADSAMLPKLINLIGDYRSRGTAVVWLTLEDSIWQDPTLPVSRRYRAVGQEIKEVTL